MSATAVRPSGDMLDVRCDRAAVLDLVHTLFAPYGGAPIRVGFMSATRPVLGQKRPDLEGVTRTNLPYPAAVGDLVGRIANLAERDREVYLSPLPWTTAVQQAPRDPQTGQPGTANLHHEVWWAWGDIDDGDPDRLPPTVLLETSPGRHAGFWRFTEPVPPTVAAEISAQIAAYIGADPSGADLTQVLRIPGTRNLSRTDLPPVRMVRKDGPEYDADELLARLPSLPERQRPTVASIAGVGAIDPNDDEPPVPLSPEALAIWRGEVVLGKPDDPGTLDRSRSLMKIGRVLYDAGLAGRYLAAELAARDIALGWRKYADRPDAAAKYADAAARIVAGGRNAPSPRPTPTVNDSRSDDERCSERCEREKAALRAELEATKLLLAGRRNRKGLGAAKDGAAEVAQAVTLIAKRAGPPRDERGYKVNLWRVEQEAGIDAKTMRAHAKTVASHALSDDDCERFGLEPGTPLWEVTTEVVPKVVTRDGRQSIDGTVTEVYIKPNVPAERLPEAIATATLPKAPRAGNPGGCRRHPDAPLQKMVTIERKTEMRCSVCHDVVSTETTVIRSWIDAPNDANPTDNDPPPPTGNDFRSTEEPESPTEGDTPLSDTVANFAAREDDDQGAVRASARRVEDARRLRATLNYRGVGLHLRSGRLVVVNEERLTDRLAGEIDEYRRELEWLLLAEAPQEGVT